jgi:hypothetical protein
MPLHPLSTRADRGVHPHSRRLTMFGGKVVPALLALAALLAPSGSSAQSMRDEFNSLFVFSGPGGGGAGALFLAGSGGVPSVQVHGSHFIPSESEANGSLLSFLNHTIGRNVANFPLSSTVASQTFEFVGGVPTPSSNSFGPIFAERGQTLGAGRFNAGINYSRLHFSSLRGIPMNRLQLTFVHENSDFPPCDTIFQVDCSEFGQPLWEHDMITLDLDLDMEAEVSALYATFGLTDWMDVGFALPVVSFRMSGVSTAKILLADGLPALHFFGGTPEAPILEAEKRTAGTSTGVGDVAARLKARILSGDVTDLALLGEVRLPTGNEEDFLGTGSLNARGVFIASASFGDFSPHLNAGFGYRGDEQEENVVEVVTGFDHRLAEWATLAIDVLGVFKVGSDEVEFPEPVVIPGAYQQVVPRTNIPLRRDDVLDGSFGFKFRAGTGFTVVTNVLVPLNEGGLRSSPIPTLGVEFTR